MALIFERIKVCILYILPQGALFSCFNVISQVGGIILNQNDFHPFFILSLFKSKLAFF